MRILAIFQNTWARDPVRCQAMLDRQPDLRAALCSRLMQLGGGLTCRRVEKAFGENCWSGWTVEESTPIVTGASNGCPPPDPIHVAGVIAKYTPDLIIAFGKNAMAAVSGAQWSGELILAPHPAARSADTCARLNDAARALDAAKARFLAKGEA